VLGPDISFGKVRVNTDHFQGCMAQYSLEGQKVSRDMILSQSTINEALSFLSGRLASTAVSYNNQKGDSLPHFLESISQKSRLKCV